MDERRVVDLKGEDMPGDPDELITELEGERQTLYDQVESLRTRLADANINFVIANSSVAYLEKRLTEVEGRELQYRNLLRQWVDRLVERRKMEPKHSREDHECEECELIAEFRVLERSQKE